LQSNHERQLKSIITVSKFYNVVIKYRLPLAITILILAIVTNLYAGFWPSFILYLIAVILLFGYFFFGPLRLIQEHMESGNMDAAEKVLNSIKFPGLLYKPIRSVYYTLKGNVAMMKQDFAGAEVNMKKGLDLGMPMKEAEGASLLQMGMLAMQKNDIRQAESYIRQALRKGLPDKENQAAAYLQLCSIMMTRREFRSAKEFFRKAKALKPTTPQIVDQIKQIEKYISRIPG
jgi:tetratricopeptide (TPR) repeat protein